MIQTVAFITIIFVLCLMIRAMCSRPHRKPLKYGTFGRESSASTQLHLVSLCDLFTLLMLILYTINGTVATLNVWLWFYPLRDTISCTSIHIFMWMSLQYCRGALYTVIITRISLAFHDSCYRYSNRILYTLYFTVLLYLMSCTFCDLMPSFKMDGSYGDTDLYPLQFCSGEYNPFIATSMLLFDVLFCTICLVLFVKPLIAIIEQNYLLNRDGPSTVLVGAVHKRDSFMELVVKYTSLSAICLVSASIGLLVVMMAENQTVMITVDNICVSLSIVLMSKFYEDWYFKMCAIPHRVWLSICKRYCMDIDGGPKNRREVRDETRESEVSLAREPDGPATVSKNRDKTATMSYRAHLIDTGQTE